MLSGRNITIRIIATPKEFDAIALAWRALETQCFDPLNYFQSYDWCSNWVRQFGNNNLQPYVMTAWRGEQLVAVWPLMVVRAAGIRRLETLGVPHTQYCGVLMRPDNTAVAEIAELFHAAMKHSGCDVILWRAIPEGTMLATILADTPEVQRSDNAASMLDLSAFTSAEDYAGRLGKVQKRNRNRRRNHLARIGALDFEVIWPGDPQFAPLVLHCTELKRRWLTETGRFSVGFSMDRYGEFLAGLSGDSEHLSGACLSVLRAGDRVVALELGFIRQRHYYAYIGGFDWDLRDLSPGKVQMDLTVGWLIDKGIDAYDLLINPADYKASWSNRSVPVSAKAQTMSWKGRIYASAWLPSVRPALKHLHRRLPKLLERISTMLRPAACLLLYV